MKVYVTKYALTTGIKVEKVGTPEDRDSGYVYTTDRYRQQFRMGRNAFLTLEEAVKSARAMRDKKIVSLEKQLRKVRGLLFSISAVKEDSP